MTFGQHSCRREGPGEYLEPRSIQWMSLRQEAKPILFTFLMDLCKIADKRKGREEGFSTASHSSKAGQSSFIHNGDTHGCCCYILVELEAGITSKVLSLVILSPAGSPPKSFTAFKIAANPKKGFSNSSLWKAFAIQTIGELVKSAPNSGWPTWRNFEGRRAHGNMLTLRHSLVINNHQQMCIDEQQPGRFLKLSFPPNGLFIALLF